MFGNMKSQIVIATSGALVISKDDFYILKSMEWVE